MALFGDKTDWKEELSDEDKKILVKILDSTKKYRYAYSVSDNVKIAQLWTALIEMRKELDKTNEMLGKVQAPWKAIVEAGDEAKKETIERLVREVLRSVDTTTDSATKKLVESLMKF